MKNIVFTLLAVAVLSTSANAGMRCKKDWTGATVCTDTTTGDTVVRCKKDWTGALVCE
jgi:hypothetical protein